MDLKRKQSYKLNFNGGAGREGRDPPDEQIVFIFRVVFNYFKSRYLKMKYSYLLLSFRIKKIN